MLFLYSGTDRDKARAAMNAAVVQVSKKGGEIIRVSDVSSAADVRAALSARGMFESGARTVVLDGVCVNEELRAITFDLLPLLAESEDHIFIFEEKPDAATRRALEKYTKTSEKFDAVKGEREDTFFAVTGAFRAGKKKELWVLLQREYASGKAPEMLHGTLFWAAKQMVLKPRASSDAVRGKKLVAALAELPHRARRAGEDLEYALERFVLSGV